MTKEQKMISQIIQNTLDYAYCDNCRYNKEIRSKTEEDDNPCEDCHRKYNQWGVSKKVANSIAIEISKILGHSFKENPKTENN